MTGAAIIAMGRTDRGATVEARIHLGPVRPFVAYPLLGLVYVTDRLGTTVESAFQYLLQVSPSTHDPPPASAR